MPLSAQLADRVAELHGREPRGLEDVCVLSETGGPVVIRVSSLVDDKPFPTLFWLVDPDINYRIERAEAGGVIALLQSRADADPSLQAAMRSDHAAHIRLRDGFMHDELRARLAQLGFDDVLAHTGIGGIADFSRIRCLHTWFAAHLVVPNTIGRLLEAYWRDAA